MGRAIPFIMHFTDFEKKILAHTLHSRGPGKHAIRSALRHLERGWKLIENMPELGVFSGITAEEESATAVFLALKKRKYPGAELLKERNHIHKSALHPFLLALGDLFKDNKILRNAELEFNKSLSPNKKELLRIRLKVQGPDGKSGLVYPYPPLNFTVKLGDKMHDFKPELSKLASKKNAKSAIIYIEELANRRNKVLYASQNGIPILRSGPNRFLNYRKTVVLSHLMAYLLIDSYSNQQMFVAQALNSFLDLLRLLPGQKEFASKHI